MQLSLQLSGLHAQAAEAGRRLSFQPAPLWLAVAGCVASAAAAVPLAVTLAAALLGAAAAWG